MRISKKAEYALRALVALSRTTGRPPLQIEEIAASERIPMKFLEQILLILKKADILKSKRGVGGGYQLNRSPDKISLGEIIRIVDGPFEPISCTKPDASKFESSKCDCGTMGGCGLGQVFTALQRQVNTFLEETTIEDVAAREVATGEMAFDI